MIPVVERDSGCNFVLYTALSLLLFRFLHVALRLITTGYITESKFDVDVMKREIHCFLHMRNFIFTANTVFLILLNEMRNCMLHFVAATEFNF